MEKQVKYIAIKVDGLPWLWFDRNSVTESPELFTGKNGWGHDGALTSIAIPQCEIRGRLESETLQYGGK